MRLDNITIVKTKDLSLNFHYDAFVFMILPMPFRRSRNCCYIVRVQAFTQIGVFARPQVLGVIINKNLWRSIPRS